MKSILIATALLLLSSNAYAQAYLGFGFGKVDYDADAISTFDDPTGLEFYIGNSLSDNLAVELSIVKFGEASDGIPPEWRLEADSLAVSMLGKSQVSETAQVFFRFGLHSWDSTISEDGFGVFGEGDGTDIFYGFGASFKVSDQVGLGFRYNIYDFDGDDVTMFSINAQIGLQ